MVLRMTGERQELLQLVPAQLPPEPWSPLCDLQASEYGVLAILGSVSEA